MNIAETLKEQLKFMNVTRKDLADRIGLSKSAIDNYLAGGSIPPLDRLYAICCALDCTIDDIMEWSGYDYDRPALHIVAAEPGERHFENIIEWEAAP